MSIVPTLAASILTALVLGLSVMVGLRVSMLLGKRVSVAAALLIGYLAISTCLHFAVLAGRFHLSSVAVLILAGFWSAPAWPRLGQMSRRVAIETASVAAAGLLVTVLVLGPALHNAMQVYRQGGLLMAHIDLYHHGAVISQLARLGAGTGNSIFLAGFDTPFYHYGLYVLPAFVAWLSGVNGTVLLLWLALPLGCLLLFIALYTLARTLLPHSMLASLSIAAASIVLFDPARDVVLQTHLFDKSSLLAASPGASYGAAVLIWAVAAVLRDRATFWVTLLASTLFLLAFRANFLILLWLVMALLLAQHLIEPLLARRWQLACLATLAVTGVLISGAFHAHLFGAAPIRAKLRVLLIGILAFAEARAGGG